jgi:DNA-binding MarR family transcriptional regulator
MKRTIKPADTATAAVSNLQAHLGYWLRFVSNHVSHAFSQKVAGQGVTVAEWVVLRQMLELGPANPSELAAKLGMTRGAISKLIDRLAVKGLVKKLTKRTAIADRRYQTVTLTAKGAKLVPTLAALADRNDAEFFGHLTAADQSRLIATLQDIARRHEWKDVPID